MKQVGIVLLVVGLLMTAFTTFTFFTTKDVVKMGDMHITKDEQHTSNWSPFIGIAIMVVGGVLVLQASKK